MVGEVPDLTDDDGHQDRLTEIRMHAQTALDALLAQYRYIGLLAGVKGPNDTDDDVDEARAAVFEALQDVFSYAEETSIDAMRSQLRATLTDAPIGSENNKHLNAALYPGSISDLHLDSAVTHITRTGGALGAYTLGSHLAREDDFLIDYLSRTGNVDQYNRYYAQHELSQNIIIAEAERRRLEAENHVPWYERFWNYIKGLYEEAIAQIKSGQWLVSIAQFTIDVALMAAEEIVIGALVAAIVVVSGGAATLAAPLIASAARVMLRVARSGARTFRVQIHKVRTPTQRGIFESDTQTLHRKTVDVERDLTPDEATAFGEGGQGSTRPDTDTAEPETMAARTGRLTPDQAMRDIRGKVLDGDLELAAARGTSRDAILARNRVIDAYGEVYGVDVSNVAGMGRGTPIEIVHFPPPETLTQWRNTTLGDTGSFFDPTGASSPSELGISSIGRTREVYSVRGEGLAIKGYGQPRYPDDFTVRGRVEETSGGTEQWFINGQDKPPLADRDSSGIGWRDLPENAKWQEQADGSFISDEGRLVPQYVPDRNDPTKTLTFWSLEAL